MLFAFQVGDQSEKDLVALMMRELQLSKKNTLVLYTKALDVWRMHAQLDEMIANNSLSYDLNRIGKVERNILRLATFELVHEKSTEPAIIIAEANRLANKFCSESACHFINAILDAISQCQLAPS